MAHSAAAGIAGARPVQRAQPVGRATAPASGGKGGANNAAPAATQMNNPTAPNVMQQSAQGLTLANEATAAGTQYQPMDVSTSMGAQQVGTEMGSRVAEAGTLPQVNISDYMNPYESQVVGQSMADLDRARQIQQMQQNAQMGAAGAFGGSRHGIAQAESNRAFYDRAGAMAGGLRQQGFQNAQQMAQQDLQRQMQASLANQQTEQTGLARKLQAGMANQNVEQQGLQRMLQAGLANQGAGLQGAGQRLQAAGQLGRLSQQGFDMGRTLTGDVREQGNMQQLMQQQLIDAAKKQFAGYTGAPASTIGYLSQALGASTIPQSQQTTKQNGIMDYLTMGTMLAASDKRLKTNIKELGRLDNGLGVYSWDWTKDADEKGLSNSMRLGFIAQEVEKVMPENVVTMPSGYLAVNYGNIFEELA